MAPSESDHVFGKLAISDSEVVEVPGAGEGVSACSAVARLSPPV